MYIIDYGLAKKYRDLQTHRHIPYRFILTFILLKEFTFRNVRIEGILRDTFILVEKTRILLEQLDMQVLTLILVLVSVVLLFYSSMLPSYLSI